jgi:pimeloyl-ACP methyl ester carboxylesterase
MLMKTPTFLKTRSKYFDAPRKTAFLILLLLLIQSVFSLSSFGQENSLNKVQSKTIVFITGAFVSNSGWEEWQKYFESKGYKTLAPAWPFKDGTAADLRARQPYDTALARLTMKEVVEYYADIIKKCPEKPIVIGHSFGGLITQIMVNRGIVEAGIAIHPAPTKGVLPYEIGFLRGGGKSLGLFTSKKKTYLMSFKKWQYAFTNEMSLTDQHASYDANTIPESKTVARGGLSNVAKVDYKKPHPPLLITSGDIDHIIPAHLNKRNFKKYKPSGSILDYKEFTGRNHYVLGLPTWKEDADYIIGWINKNSI